jgi:hypothetical protein
VAELSSPSDRVFKRNKRNKPVFMGFLRFSKRNIGGICYAYESEFRLVFAEAVTLLRFAFFYRFAAELFAFRAKHRAAGTGNAHPFRLSS